MHVSHWSFIWKDCFQNANYSNSVCFHHIDQVEEWSVSLICSIYILHFLRIATSMVLRIQLSSSALLVYISLKYCYIFKKNLIHSCPLGVVPFQLYGRLSQFPCPHPLFSVYHNSVMVNIKNILQNWKFPIW